MSFPRVCFFGWLSHGGSGSLGCRCISSDPPRVMLPLLRFRSHFLPGPARSVFVVYAQRLFFKPAAYPPLPSRAVLSV